MTMASPASRWLRGDSPFPDSRANGRRLSLRGKGWVALASVAGLVLLLATLVAAYHLAIVRLSGPDAAQQGRALAVSLGVAATLGSALIGAAVVLFFRQLAVDIDLLRVRALGVIGGDRSPLPPLARDDELGDLAAALDAMVRALAAREHDLEIERRNVFHQEKMAAIGALAAGVLHDIGNPIAAIDGFARAMKEARTSAASGDVPALPDALSDPELILQQTERLRVVTRRIGELAAAHSSELRLVNLNELVQTTLLLLNFDPRLEGVRVQTELDSQLPAVEAAGDRIVQLLMNLVINAADAVRSQSVGEAALRLVRVRTEATGTSVLLSVADNGPGMDDVVLARAFEPLFTTKPAGSGTGLGLPLCRTIAQQHGGELTIDTRPGGGTRVALKLPVAGLS